MAYNCGTSSGSASDETIFDLIKLKRLNSVKHFVKQNVRDLFTPHQTSKECPLHYAIRYSSPEIIEYFYEEYLKHDKLKNYKKDLLSYAVQYGSYDSVTTLLKTNEKFEYLNSRDFSGWYPLMYAVKKSDRDLTKLLIKNGADTSLRGKDGKTPLAVAVEEQDLYLIRFLLDNGANVTIQSSFLYAIETGDLRIVNILKENGALVGFKYSNGYTPIFKAVEKGYLNILKYLISECPEEKDESTDLNQIGPCGSTLLTKAVFLSFFEMVKFLVEAGASVNMADKNGKYPLAIACAKESLQIAKYFIEVGADPSLAQNEIEYLRNKDDDFQVFMQFRQKLKAVGLGSGHEAVNE